VEPSGTSCSVGWMARLALKKNSEPLTVPALVLGVAAKHDCLAIAGDQSWPARSWFALALLLPWCCGAWAQAIEIDGCVRRVSWAAQVAGRLFRTISSPTHGCRRNGRGGTSEADLGQSRCPNPCLVTFRLTPQRHNQSRQSRLDDAPFWRVAAAAAHHLCSSILRSRPKDLLKQGLINEQKPNADGAVVAIAIDCWLAALCHKKCSGQEP
jgi:hypothetical protein